MIEQNILNAMLQTGVLAITIPVVLIVAWKMYTKRSLVPFWVGIMVFIAFSRMLEMIPHSLFLLSSNPVSKAINGNVVLYVIYAATVAALFEETGRYLAFRFVLTKHPNKVSAMAVLSAFLCLVLLIFSIMRTDSLLTVVPWTRCFLPTRTAHSLWMR